MRRQTMLKKVDLPGVESFSLTGTRPDFDPLRNYLFFNIPL